MKELKAEENAGIPLSRWLRSTGHARKRLFSELAREAQAQSGTWADRRATRGEPVPADTDLTYAMDSGAANALF
jgi:hypothetical protein